MTDPSSNHTEKSSIKLKHKLVWGIIFGVMASIILTYMWTRTTTFLGFEPVWYGPIIGFITGLGVALGNGFTKKSGIIAAIIVSIALVGGKYFNAGICETIEKKFQKEIIEKYIPNFNNDEVVISFLTDIIITNRIAQGDSTRLPGHSTRHRETWKNDYPPEIWKKAEHLWLSLPDSVKEQRRNDSRIEEEEKLKSIIKCKSRIELFIDSFSGIRQIIYILLTLISAFIIPAFIKIKHDSA